MAKAECGAPVHGKWPSTTAQWPPVAGNTWPVQRSRAWNAGTFVAKHGEDGRAQWSRAQQLARHDIDCQAHWGQVQQPNLAWEGGRRSGASAKCRRVKVGQIWGEEMSDKKKTSQYMGLRCVKQW
jgi:hypothetical protein